MESGGRPELRSGAGRAVVTLCLLGGLPGCTGTRGPGGTTVVDDRERGVHYVVPAGWLSFDGEARSGDGSLLTIRVHSLVGADSNFVAALPESIVPQLEEWARTYYIVDGPPTRGETTIGGLPATMLTYPVRIRASSPPSSVVYWVVRTEDRLFILRYAHPPDAPPEEEASLKELLASFSFL